MNPKLIHEILFPAFAALVGTISKRCYGTAWESGIEVYLWGACGQLQRVKEQKDVCYGQDTITRAEAMALLHIAEVAGGWWLGRQFVEWETWSKDFRETTGKQSPFQPNTAGHHGAPIITQQDVALLSTMVRWIATVRNAGKTEELRYGSKTYDEGWLPSEVDIIKSRLFWRLRSGKEPLPAPPPTAYSCPWYEVIEDDRPHWCYEDVKILDGTNNSYYPYHKTVYIAQCPYEVIEATDTEGIAKFGPWHFRFWKGTTEQVRPKRGIDQQPIKGDDDKYITETYDLAGTYIQRILEEITEEDRATADRVLGIDRSKPLSEQKPFRCFDPVVGSPEHKTMKKLERELLVKSEQPCSYQEVITQGFRLLPAGIKWLGLEEISK